MGRSRVTDDQLREAAPLSRTLVEVLTRVGLVPCGGNYTIVRRRLAALGLLEQRFLPRAAPAASRPRLPDVADDALARAVASSTTLAGVLRALGLPPDPGLVVPLRARIEADGLSLSHLRGRGWARGTRRPRLPLDQVLVDGRATSSGALRRRLVAEGLLERACSGCGLTAWQGRLVPLELDHVNGRREDNRLENLRLLCPNCHALTDTWRGRNIGRSAP